MQFGATTDLDYNLNKLMLLQMMLMLFSIFYLIIYTVIVITIK